MKKILLFSLILLLFTCSKIQEKGFVKRPNIIFIMSDDHATQAISSYGSRINQTPQIDKLAAEGIQFNNAFVTNAICSPSRAVILTGKHSHLNGVKDNHTRFDSSQLTFPKILRREGYETAIIGKWHLKSQPTGFDHWNVLPGQGDYYNPAFNNNGKDTIYEGYITNITTDLAVDWLAARTSDKPFMLMVHQKAPHRNWMPDLDDLDKYEDITFSKPPTFHDDYKGKEHLKGQKLTVAKHMDISLDLKVPCDTCWRDAVNSWALNHSKKKLGRLNAAQKAKWDAGYKREIAEFIDSKFTETERTDWNLKRYLQDYLRCIISIDESIGKINSYVAKSDLAENTLIIYTSDQGFFLGEHGLFDKRYMYEESFRTPMIMKYPKKIQAGITSNELVQNLDIAPTILNIAGVEIPQSFQGETLVPLFENTVLPNWRQAVYYEFFESGWGVPKHHGVRTKNHKLIYIDSHSPSWELYDLKADPHEMNNLYAETDYQPVVKEMKSQLNLLREKYQVNNYK